MVQPFFPGLRKGYSEVKSTGHKPSTKIFVKFDNKVPAGLPKNPKVKAGNIRTKIAKLSGSRGLSDFQLFCTLHVEETGNNRFNFGISNAEVDAEIQIMPKNEFNTLADFATVYADFDQDTAWSSGWRHGADKLTEKWVGVDEWKHWSTKFTGIMAKTVRHELDHVKFGIDGCEGMLYNLNREGKKAGKLGGKDPCLVLLQKQIDGIMGNLGFPYFDLGAKEHKAIAVRDCLFMVAWYECYHLKIWPLSNAGWEAWLAAIYDNTLSSAIKQVGETFPWVPK